MALEGWAQSWSVGSGACADDVAALYHEDAEYWAVPLGARTAGRDMKAYAAAFFAAAPDAICEVRGRVDAGSRTVLEWTWSGTWTGDLAGRTATGRPFISHGCSVFDVEDGRIRAERGYWDWEALTTDA